MIERSQSPDPDLHEVFNLLYGDDDWDIQDGEGEEGVDPGRARDLELNVVESTVDSDPFGTAKYTLEYFSTRLDSLLHPPPPTSEQDADEGRIFKRRRVAASGSSYPYTISPPALPSPEEYLPHSPLALLSRLRTYQPFNFPANLPESLSPVRLASRGWINNGKGVMRCGRCEAHWSMAGLQRLEKGSLRDKVAGRLGQEVAVKHGPCPWKEEGSLDSTYRRLWRSLHPTTSSSLTELAMALEDQMRDLDRIPIMCPLDQTQLDQLASRLRPYATKLPSRPTSQEKDADAVGVAPLNISSTAAALSLSGWLPYHPNQTSSGSCIAMNTTNSSTNYVRCRICERRIGLWHFGKTASTGSSSVFDVLGEHLVWCPIRCLREVDGQPWWTAIPQLEQGESGGWKDITPGGVKARLKAMIPVSQKLPRKSWWR